MKLLAFPLFAALCLLQSTAPALAVNADPHHYSNASYSGCGTLTSVTKEDDGNITSATVVVPDQREGHFANLYIDDRSYLTVLDANGKEGASLEEGQCLCAKGSVLLPAFSFSFLTTLSYTASFIEAKVVDCSSGPKAAEIYEEVMPNGSNSDLGQLGGGWTHM